MSDTESPRERVEGKVVDLDYGHFQSKHFYNCKMVFKGGRPPTLINCTFDTSEFIFEGPALNTLRFLGALAGGKDNQGGKDFVLYLLGITR